MRLSTAPQTLSIAYERNEALPPQHDRGLHKPHRKPHWHPSLSTPIDFGTRCKSRALLRTQCPHGGDLMKEFKDACDVCGKFAVCTGHEGSVLCPECLIAATTVVAHGT